MFSSQMCCVSVWEETSCTLKGTVVDSSRSNMLVLLDFNALNLHRLADFLFLCYNHKLYTMSSAWSVHVIFFQLSSLCNNFKIHKMFFLEKTHCYKGQHSYSSSVHKNKLMFLFSAQPARPGRFIVSRWIAATQISINFISYPEYFDM